VRLTSSKHEGREPGATFRVDCPCGAFTLCHVTSELPVACARCTRPLPDAISRRLSALRPSRGISIPEVAAALAVSVATVRAWEADRAPIPPAKRASLAVLLRVTPDLFRDRPNESQPLKPSDSAKAARGSVECEPNPSEPDASVACATSYDDICRRAAMPPVRAPARHAGV
jgi:transcriptional regulator with XRE-family HTH domain